MGGLGGLGVLLDLGLHLLGGRLALGVDLVQPANRSLGISADEVEGDPGADQEGRDGDDEEQVEGHGILREGIGRRG